MSRRARRRQGPAGKRPKPAASSSAKDRFLIGSVIAVFAFFLVFMVAGLVAEAATGRCLKCVLTRDYQCALCPRP